METEKVLGTKERVKVLEFILDNPSKKASVRGLSKTLGLSPSHLSKTIRILEKNSILKGNRINLENPLVRNLKTMFNLKKLLEMKVVEKSRLVIKDMKGIGVYGSWASGTNTEDSDIDLWIKSRRVIEEKSLAKIHTFIITKTGSEVSILSLWPGKIEELKKDKTFYYSLHFGSIILWGENID